MDGKVRNEIYPETVKSGLFGNDCYLTFQIYKHPISERSDT